jgi:bacillithiol system protein YtxJ
MSLFKNLFGSEDEQKNTSNVTWNQLTDLGELNEIITISEEKPVVIFKHSTRCSISRMALKQFENQYDAQENVVPYFLDLLKHRDISNEIAIQFNVQHQSPQILVIKDGKSVYNASHSDIDADDLKRFL